MTYQLTSYTGSGSNSIALAVSQLTNQLEKVGSGKTIRLDGINRAGYVWYPWVIYDT